MEKSYSLYHLICGHTSQAEFGHFTGSNSPCHYLELLDPTPSAVTPVTLSSTSWAKRCGVLSRMRQTL